MATATDFLSLTTTPVFLLQGERVVSRGSGFLYCEERGASNFLYLITNIHVLTGRDPEENFPAEGNAIKILLHQKVSDTSDVNEVVIDLYGSDGCPRWITNKKYPKADLAALLIPPEKVRSRESKAICCVTKTWTHYKHTNMVVEPSSEVAIIGYPHHFYDRINQIPIWKFGNIASEPKLNFEGQPLILVDAAAYPGMSGSPVYVFSNNAYSLEDGTVNIGGCRQLIGVYAGNRIVEKEIKITDASSKNSFSFIQEESLQLGDVWKISILLEIMRNIP